MSSSISPPTLTLTLLDQTFAVCRLPVNSVFPGWALDADFVSITRTREELSIVCREVDIPPIDPCEKGWRCLKVNGPLDFSLVGILSRLISPLADANISIFALSTFDTDYLLIKQENIETAVRVLTQQGYIIQNS